MNYTKSIFTVLLCFLSLALFAQNKLSKQYAYAKSLIDEERYEAAVQVLGPLTKEQKGNTHVLSSQYLYAYCFFQQEQYQIAKDMLLQLKQNNPEWEEIVKVNWLLASAYNRLGEYRKSVAIAQSLSPATTFLSDWKEEYYPAIKPFDTLLAIHRSTPLDVQLASLVYQQIKNSPDLKEKHQYVATRLEQEYGFTSEIKKVFQNKVRDKYHLALLLPFQMNDAESMTGQRSNQYVYDLYAGMKIAVDSLNKDKKKAPIVLHAYDTEKDVNKLAQILKYEEWKRVDLVIGPVFPEQCNYIKEAPEIDNKVLVNPFSSNIKFTERSGTYLYKNSIEFMASSMIKLAAEKFVLRKNTAKDPGEEPKKDVVILYGKETKDSVLAYQYKDSIVSKGFVVKLMMKVVQNYMPALRTWSSDSLALMNVSHVVALASDQVFAANFISLMEITQQYIPIYTYSDWLDYTQLSYVQMEKRGVHFLYPDYVRINSPGYKNFYKAYLSAYNVYPSVYVLQGYEMVSLLGKALREKGTDVSLYFDERKYISLGMLGGYDYSNASCNKFLPIVAFKDHKLNIVNEETR